MTTARAAAALGPRERSDARSRLLGAVVSLAGPVVLLGLALLLLFLPVYMHAALDAAGSAEMLGLRRAEAQALSDRTVAELFLGPGTFDFAGPAGERFYGSDEAAHLRDVRLTLFAFLGIVLVSALVLTAVLLRDGRRPYVWRALARGGALLAGSVLVVGLFALVAFELAFELFHRVLFPAGNWAFDPGSQRLVQLYGLPFWQLTGAALALLAIGLGLATWLLARRRAAALERRGNVRAGP